MKFTTREIYIIIAGLMFISAIVVVGLGYKMQGKVPQEEGAAGEEQVSVPHLTPNPDETSKAAIGRLGRKTINTYRVTATSEGYSPWKLIAEENSVIHIDLTSAGGTYDWYIPELGYNVSSSDGETKYLRFLAPPQGVYRITCNEYCPSGGNLIGSLIIVGER